MRAHEACAEVLRQRIADGTYALGSVFPAVSVLAAAFGLDTNTIWQARRILVREGLLASPPGDVLTFVRAGHGQSVPQYKQELATILRRRIEDGIYPRGTQIPNTRDLARELGVGMVAMRCAINQVSEEGHFEIRSGKTYVTAQGPSST